MIHTSEFYVSWYIVLVTANQLPGQCIRLLSIQQTI